MRKFLSSIPKQIARTSLAGALGIAMLGGAAYADETVAQRHEQEMAAGNPADAAYKAAGYRKHRGNAARMANPARPRPRAPASVRKGPGTTWRY